MVYQEIEFLRWCCRYDVVFAWGGKEDGCGGGCGTAAVLPEAEEVGGDAEEENEWKGVDVG